MNALDQSYKSAATDQDARCAMHVLDAECMRNRDYLRRHGYSSAQIEKMSPSLFKILKANNPNICLLKSDEDTYRMLAKMMQPFDLEKDLLKMDNWSAVNKWRVGGKDLTFMCKLNGPIRKVKDRWYLWERYSKLYGRAKDEVAADVARREMALFEVTEKKRGK